MDSTHKVPNVSVEKFKRTKIIATLGPSSNDYATVLELVKAGVNGFRLNFSHGDHDEHARRIKWVRKASLEYGKPVAVIQDLQGPKIRLGDFEGIVHLHAGQNIVFEYDADYERSGHIPTQYDLSDKVKRGETIYLFDGKVRTTVTSVTGKHVHVHVENDGMIIKRKGMNLPDTDFGGDIITDKDKADLAFGSTQDIDYVAQSFAQTASDVRALRRLMKTLGMQAKIITKFETKSAVEHMEEIVEETDAIMIARGDLAVETPAESVPIIQRKLIGLGLRYAKPTIVATQMLLTMTETPEPTRAEVSDVATAVIVGADCVMLSDETASGQYPVEAVHVMKRIIMYTQENAPLSVIFPSSNQDPSKHDAICSAVINLADATHAKAIVAETKSGATAIKISSMRPGRPVLAVTSDKRVAQQLVLVYGLKTYVRPDDKHQATKLTNWLQQKRVLKSGDMVVTASGKYPGVVGATDTIKVRTLD
jgi:pyruvate kinase